MYETSGEASSVYETYLLFKKFHNNIPSVLLQIPQSGAVHSCSVAAGRWLSHVTLHPITSEDSLLILSFREHYFKPLWRGGMPSLWSQSTMTHWLIQANPPVAGLDAYVNANEKLNWPPELDQLPDSPHWVTDFRSHYISPSTTL